MGLCLKGHCPARARVLELGGQGNYKASFGKMTLAPGLAKQLIPMSYSANSQKETKLIYIERNIIQLAHFGGEAAALWADSWPPGSLTRLPHGAQCPTLSICENCSTETTPTLPAQIVTPGILLYADQHNPFTC